MKFDLFSLIKADFSASFLQSLVLLQKSSNMILINIDQHVLTD